MMTKNANNSSSIRIGRVGIAELTALITIYCSTDVFLSYPSRVAVEGATAAWMIPLIAGVITFAVFLLLYLAMRKTPTQNLIELVMNSLSPFIGIPVAIAFSVFFFLQTAIVMREFTETVVTTVLPRTPSEIIAASFLLVVVYYAYKGLEGLTRVAVLIAYILGVGLVILLVLPLTWFHLPYLMPLAGRGWNVTLMHSLLNTSAFANVLMLAILYPAVRNQQHFVRAGLMSILFTALTMSAVLFVVLGVFTDAVSGQVSFPLYQLARLIYVGRFVQRLEAVFVFLWTAGAVLKMGFGLWLSGYLYAAAFRMPVYRPILFPLALLIYVFVFLPQNIMAVEALESRIIEPFAWIVELLAPLVLVIVSVGINHLRGANRQAQS